ncbi:hypothetical protein [Ensifer sp. 4252]|uniref:hypothetical protein n=1 Tax=Ensifer sp. 4252 TaxID=3373915 RepID=UPI003D24901D
MSTRFLTAFALTALLAISGCATSGSGNTTYSQAQGVDPDIDPTGTGNDSMGASY